MKFEMTVQVKDESREPWKETYDKRELTTVEEVEQWCRDTIDFFNASLSLFEEPRKFISVEIVSEISGEHDWRKTNLMTIRGATGGYWDTYECADCGITGKRYGLNDYVKRDPSFKAKGYEKCDQAKVLLERRRQRRKAKERTDEVD